MVNYVPTYTKGIKNISEELQMMLMLCFCFFFLIFFSKTYVLGTHLNCIDKDIPL